MPTWNHLTECKQISSDSFRNNVTDKSLLLTYTFTIYIYKVIQKGWYAIKNQLSGAETGQVLLLPGRTNNSVNVIQNGLKIIHKFQANILSLISIKLRIYSSFDN